MANYALSAFFAATVLVASAMFMGTANLKQPVYQGIDGTIESYLHVEAIGIHDHDDDEDMYSTAAIDSPYHYDSYAIDRMKNESD